MFWHQLPNAAAFRSMGELLTFARDESLPLGEHVFFIDSGIAALMMLTDSGDEKVYQYFKVGNITGSIRYIMPREQVEHSYLSVNVSSLVAKTPLRVYAIRHTAFFETLDEQPRLYKDLSISLTQNLSNVLEHSYWLAGEDAATRVCLMLLNFMEPEAAGRHVLPKCFTYREMSSFLSIHTVTIAKICKALIGSGVIRREGHTLYTDDFSGLRALALKQKTLSY